jgi:hypothetical protein
MASLLYASGSGTELKSDDVAEPQLKLDERFAGVGPFLLPTKINGRIPDALSLCVRGQKIMNTPTTPANAANHRIMPVSMPSSRYNRGRHF